MTGLDWRDRKHWGGGRSLPCILCTRPALCRDDQGRPCHKTCAEAAQAPITRFDSPLGSDLP